MLYNHFFYEKPCLRDVMKFHLHSWAMFTYSVLQRFIGETEKYFYYLAAYQMM
jgi:hypothetical protein